MAVKEQWLVWEKNELALTPFNLLGVHTVKTEAEKHATDADAYARQRGSWATHWVAGVEDSLRYPYVERGNGPCGRAYRAWRQAQERKKCR